MKIKLSTAVNITTGKLDANAADSNGIYPFYTCSPEPLKINSYAFDADAILLAGNNAGGTFHINRYSGKFNAYQRTYVLTAKDGYNLDYIYYSLQLSLKSFKKKSQGSQTKFLTMGVLSDFEIDDIPLDEQNKKVRLLNILSKKINNNEKILKLSEYIAKTFYNYWFLQFEFPDKSGKPYKSSSGIMEWSEELKRNIPNGWNLGNLFDIANFVNGLACQNFRPIDDTHKLPVVKIVEMHSGISNDTEWVRDDINEKHIINSGDILFSWSASLETMFWNGGRAGLNQHIFKVLPKTYGKYYVYQQLSAYVINFVKMANARKTTMGHITTDHLKQSRIVLPPEDLVSKFETIVGPLFEHITRISEENRELTNLRDFLLPLLMNGQAEITE